MRKWAVLYEAQFHERVCQTVRDQSIDSVSAKLPQDQVEAATCPEPYRCQTSAVISKPYHQIQL